MLGSLFQKPRDDPYFNKLKYAQAACSPFLAPTAMHYTFLFGPVLEQAR